MRNLKLGSLPLNASYTLESIFDGDYCPCDNCGKMICNIAEIKNQDGKTFFVGLDCAETLQSAELSDYFQRIDKIKRYNKYKSHLAKAKKCLKAGGIYLVSDSETRINPKGKPSWSDFVTASRYIPSEHREVFENKIKDYNNSLKKE